jgi:hypothetical protein
MLINALSNSCERGARIWVVGFYQSSPGQFLFPKIHVDTAIMAMRCGHPLEGFDRLCLFAGRWFGNGRAGCFLACEVIVGR